MYATPMTVELCSHIRKKHNVLKKEIKLIILAREAMCQRAGFWSSNGGKVASVCDGCIVKQMLVILLLVYP